MKNLITSFCISLIWASSPVSANVVSVLDGVVIGQMTQRTGPPPSELGQFTGAPKLNELQDYLNEIAQDDSNWWSNAINYPIVNINADHQLSIDGVNLTLSNDGKSVDWELDGFGNEFNIFFVFKNAKAADLILATASSGSVTLSHGLSNWGVFLTDRSSSPDLEPVPIPAAIWLLGSAFAFLASYSQRSNRP